jgi:chromosome condensin MukBEF ATPase and DNA-binding subunit MukB
VEMENEGLQKVQKVQIVDVKKTSTVRNSHQIRNDVVEQVERKDEDLLRTCNVYLSWKKQRKVAL